MERWHFLLISQRSHTLGRLVGRSFSTAPFQATQIREAMPSWLVCGQGSR